MLEKGNKKVTRAWLMYDWANSVYHLTITTAIFPIYYAGVASSISNGKINFCGLNSLPDALYNYALALAFLVIGGISPLLSGIADYTGNKKAFMKFFCYMGALACSSLFFFTSSAFWVGIVMVIFACI